MHDVTPGESSDWDDRPKLGIFDIVAAVLARRSPCRTSGAFVVAPDFARLAENMAKILGLDRGRVYSIFYPDQDQTRGAAMHVRGPPHDALPPASVRLDLSGGPQAALLRLDGAGHGAVRAAAGAQ